MSQTRKVLEKVADRLTQRADEAEDIVLVSRLLEVAASLRAVDDETIAAIEADEVKIEGQEVQTQYSAPSAVQELQHELAQAQDLIDRQRAVIDTLQARMEKIREAAVWR